MLQLSCFEKSFGSSQQAVVVAHYRKRSPRSFDLPWLFFVCVGVESPSHAIRADADPLARSATSVVITLADKYTYDCPVEILIYPSGRSRSN